MTIYEASDENEIPTDSACRISGFPPPSSSKIRDRAPKAHKASRPKAKTLNAEGNAPRNA
jgi:hypothetical protein